MKNYFYHNLTVGQVIKKFKVNPLKGLSDTEAKTRLSHYGSNEIPENKPRFPVLTLLWHQMNNAMVYILLLAAIITYFIGHFTDTYVILAVIVINTTIGFVQEYRANKAIEALKEMVVSLANVYRNGQLLKIPASQLVPGDIIYLAEGDRVPADARLIEAKSFRTVESSLTGEAFPASKETGTLSIKTPLADRKNSVWLGTFVVGGWARAVVTATGAKTTIGKLSQTLGEIDSGKTHFEEKTSRLIKQMAIIAMFGASITFSIGFFVRNLAFGEILIFSVASLVSGIPTGMPAVLAIVLAAGASRMAKRKAIIRSLPATETLSVTDVIAVDKTGTLTQNKMTVERIVTKENDFQVSGNGWHPGGEFFEAGQEIDPKKSLVLTKLVLAGGLCSRAKLVTKEASSGGVDYQINGDPTEGALTVLTHKARLEKDLADFNIIDELPFDQKLRYKAVLAERQGQEEVFVSGAPEMVLSFCVQKLVKNKKVKLDQKEKEEILAKVLESTRQGMRVLVLACRDSKNLKKFSHQAITGLAFIGFVVMADPPRSGVKEAVLKAKRAGLRIVMKTGDHKETALAIARQVGIIDDNLKKNNDFPFVLTGEELFSFSPHKFKEAVKNVSVFARLTPDMKLKILEALQEIGHCVAMSGDGVNDVLALKKADIGIAMGNIGSDAARESSDIVLADDNFVSIVDAIEEGRIVFNNTRQASAFLANTCLTEDLIIVTTIILGLPLPLSATQILWLNLVTSGVIDAALAAEPGHGDVLKQKPRRKGESILSFKMITFLAPIILLMVFLVLGVFLRFLPQGIGKARTAAFSMMAFAQLFNIFNLRSLERSVFDIGIFSNKYIILALIFSLTLQYLALTRGFFMNLLRFEPLTLLEAGTMALLASSVFWCGEISKLIRSKLIKEEE